MAKVDTNKDLSKFCLNDNIYHLKDATARTNIANEITRAEWAESTLAYFGINNLTSGTDYFVGASAIETALSVVTLSDYIIILTNNGGAPYLVYGPSSWDSAENILTCTDGTELDTSALVNCVLVKSDKKLIAELRSAIADAGKVESVNNIAPATNSKNVYITGSDIELSTNISTSIADAFIGVQTQLVEIPNTIKTTAKNADSGFTNEQSSQISIYNKLVAIESEIAAKTNFSYTKVQTLPTASVDTMNKIYLVPKESPSTGYKEWLTLEDNSTTPAEYSWEEIGDTDVDLSDYATKAEVSTSITTLQDEIDGQSTFLAGLISIDETNEEITFVTSTSA